MKKRDKIFLILCFVSFIIPNFTVKISFLNNIGILFAVICLIILILKTIRHNTPLDLTFILLLIWRLLIFIPTFQNNGEIIKWGYQSVIFLGIYLLIKNYLLSQDTIKIIYKILFLYIVINLILMLIFPKGLFPEFGIYFLGIRTRFTEYAIALIYISILYYLKFSNRTLKDRKKVIISSLIAISNILIQWVATGIVTIILIVVLYFILRNKNTQKLIYSLLFVLLIVITINLVNGSIENLLSGVLKLLNKDSTLTGRTVIWNHAIILATQHWISGVGYLNDGNIISYSGGLWQAHNTLLQAICESGLLGAIILFALIYIQGLKANEDDNKKVRALNSSVILGFIIMMMTEILYYYPIFIFIILLIGNSHKISNKKKEFENDKDKTSVKESTKRRERKLY